eukprot:GHVU01180841.1.p1 GENE.GHVU01180841.1~~GHVU01180841.1.p1  ORF type:complete len:267 (-),score=45.80 GHVU01180841.1:238-1038(-)
MKRVANCVDSIAWTDRAGAPIFCFLSRGTCVFWPLPSLAFFRDNGLLLESQETVELAHSSTNGARILDVSGVTAHVFVPSDQLQLLAVTGCQAWLHLHSHRKQNNWGAIAKICRRVDAKSCWAVMAGLALEAKDMAAADLAFAALKDTCTLQQIERIERIDDPTRREGEMLCLRGDVDAAVKLLLERGLVYRAIKVLIRAHNWPQALAIAQQHSQHVDTVCGYRSKFLSEAGGLKESLAAFIKAKEQVTIDWPKICENIRLEKSKG